MPGSMVGKIPPLPVPLEPFVSGGTRQAGLVDGLTWSHDRSGVRRYALAAIFCRRHHTTFSRWAVRNAHPGRVVCYQDNS